MHESYILLTNQGAGCQVSRCTTTTHGCQRLMYDTAVFAATNNYASWDSLLQSKTTFKERMLVD